MPGSFEEFDDRHEAENTFSHLPGHPEQSPEHIADQLQRWSSLIQGRETMKTIESYLGIDVSKRTLHLATSEKFVRQFDNSPAGHQELVKRIRETGIERVAMEASGGYERIASDALRDAGLMVSIAQPSCVKNFARSKKVLAKTDEIDARVIACFAEATQPDPTPPTPENSRKLRALSDRRAQVVGDRVREENRLEACPDPAIRGLIEDSIEKLKAAEADLDRQISDLLCDDAELSQKSMRLQQQKGVGEKTAAVLLAHFPELGSLTRQSTAALAGLAPYAQESGTWKGRRRIYGGRAIVRKAMYMAAKSAAQWCPVISKFYDRLRANGKTYNQAIIACARKMLVRLNTVLRDLENEMQQLQQSANSQKTVPIEATAT